MDVSCEALRGTHGVMGAACYVMSEIDWKLNEEFVCAGYGHGGCVAMFLGRGAETGVVDGKGRTPLRIATQYAHYGMCLTMSFPKMKWRSNKCYFFEGLDSAVEWELALACLSLCVPLFRFCELVLGLSLGVILEEKVWLGLAGPF